MCVCPDFMWQWNHFIAPGKATNAQWKVPPHADKLPSLQPLQPPVCVPLTACQPAVQIQVQTQSNKGLNITLLHIPTAPRQIVAKPNKISDDTDTIPPSTTLSNTRNTLTCTWAVSTLFVIVNSVHYSEYCNPSPTAGIRFLRNIAGGKTKLLWESAR
jgi:hypothetical protein